jgi:hypothetical protein
MTQKATQQNSTEVPSAEWVYYFLPNKGPVLQRKDEIASSEIVGQVMFEGKPANVVRLFNIDETVIDVIDAYGRAQ